MRTYPAMLLLFVTSALTAQTPRASGTVAGTVTSEDLHVPGVEVALHCGDDVRYAITAANGEYSFEGVPAGPCAIAFQLEGLITTTAELLIKGAPAEANAVMALAGVAETITLDSPCGGSEGVQTGIDYPPCSEYNLDDRLARRLRQGELAVLPELQRRYDAARVLSERNRIAASLLNRVADDTVYWRQLEDTAWTAVTFASADESAIDEKLASFCRSRGWMDERAPIDYRSTAIAALSLIAIDRRSGPVLAAALRTSDPSLIGTAIAAYARRHDDAALPDIEASLRRLPENEHWAAIALRQYRTAEADRIAVAVLEPRDVDEYLTSRPEELIFTDKEGP